MPEIIVIAHNIRSCHNVGSLLRTSEGLGVDTVYLSGYTPYPVMEHDPRLPHEAHKIQKQISKTALGAEISQKWAHTLDLTDLLSDLRKRGFTIAALEQTTTSVALPTYTVPKKIVLILGREVEGIEPEVLRACDIHLEIPMSGRKESFNVAAAAAMALYHCRFVAH